MTCQCERAALQGRVSDITISGFSPRHRGAFFHPHFLGLETLKGNNATRYLP